MIFFFFLQLGLERQTVRHFTLQPREDICQVQTGYNSSLERHEDTFRELQGSRVVEKWEL